MKLIPVKDIADDAEFYRGRRFRIYNIGLNVADKADDYYEYMLAELPGDHDYMLLTNVVGYKSGSALALVKISNDAHRVVVTGAAIKFSLGTEDTFYLEDEF